MADHHLIRKFSDNVVRIENAPRIEQSYRCLVESVARFWYDNYRGDQSWRDTVIDSNEDDLFMDIIYCPSMDETMTILGFAMAFNNVFTEEHDNVDDVVDTVMRCVYSDAYDVLRSVALS